MLGPLFRGPFLFQRRIFVILYEGPSHINGDPVVAIATGFASPSTNRKTGPMIQTWILAQDEAPHVAVKSGNDEAVCGDCPARGKWCYVTTFHGPRSIWETWKRGGYPKLDLNLFKGESVRFGAYGDPAAIPFHIWDDIAMVAKMVTGYTHAWHYCDPMFKAHCMASVDTVEQAIEAQKEGWRTFRLTESPGDKVLSKEIVCPASDEAGKKLQCIDCGACNGIAGGRKSNIIIKAHGAKTTRYEEWMTN
jgi:hypothetical protein